MSFALHGAGLLDTTLDSTGLARWGQAGPGTWITVYANKTHTYLVVAGVRFDTSGQPGRLPLAGRAAQRARLHGSAIRPGCSAAPYGAAVVPPADGGRSDAPGRTARTYSAEARAVALPVPVRGVRR